MKQRKIILIRETSKLNGIIEYHAVASVNELKLRAYHMKYNDNWLMYFFQYNTAATYRFVQAKLAGIGP